MMTLLLLLLFRHKCSETRCAGLFPRRRLSPPRRRLNVNLNLSCCAGGAQCVPTKTVQQPARGRLKVGDLALSGAVYR